MKGSPSSYRLKRNSNKNYPSSNFLKRKPCTFLFLQIFPAGLSNQITLIFLINMKNLKSDFFYEYNSYAKMTGNECLCCNSTVKPRK